MRKHSIIIDTGISDYLQGHQGSSSSKHKPAALGLIGRGVNGLK